MATLKEKASLTCGISKQTDTPKEPASSVILGLAGKVSTISSAVAAAVESRLEKVCNRYPQTLSDCDGEANPYPNYPEYFSELYREIKNIEQNLEAITETLERCEL